MPQHTNLPTTHSDARSDNVRVARLPFTIDLGVGEWLRIALEGQLWQRLVPVDYHGLVNARIILVGGGALVVQCVLIFWAEWCLEI